MIWPDPSYEEENVVIDKVKRVVGSVQTIEQAKVAQAYVTRAAKFVTAPSAVKSLENAFKHLNTIN